MVTINSQRRQTKAHEYMRVLRLSRLAGSVRSPYFLDRDMRLKLRTMGQKAVVLTVGQDPFGDFLVFPLFINSSGQVFDTPQNIQVSGVTGSETPPDLTAKCVTAILGYASTMGYTTSASDIIWLIPNQSAGTLYDSGTKYSNSFSVSGQGTVNSSGIATFYLTDNGLSTGNAVFQNVNLDTLQAMVWLNTGLYNFGTPTLSADKKSITVTVKQLTFSTGLAGVLSVLTGAAYNNAASGTVVTFSVTGQ